MTKIIPAIPGGMRGVVFDDVATPSPRPVRTGWRKRLWLLLRRRPF